MIHENSVKSYQELKPLSKRCKAVVGALGDLGVATDRRIKDHLGFPDMNNVRPRVNELIKMGIVMEHHQELCDVTNKTVRAVTLSSPNKDQMEMEFMEQNTQQSMERWEMP